MGSHRAAIGTSLGGDQVDAMSSDDRHTSHLAIVNSRPVSVAI